jgi:hypothetical protein
MITVNIGRTFLRAYNQKYEKELTAKEFFDQEYFELFFNHPKYLQWAGNSEFVQGIRTMQNGKLGIQYRGLDNNIMKFESKEKADEFVSQAIWDNMIDVEIRKEKNKSVYFLVKTLSLDERKNLLNKFSHKVDKCLDQNNIDSSMAIGFPASEVDDFGQYSGLVTDIPINPNLDEILFSWIGSSLSIGVSGGFSILFNQPEILLQTYEGWKVYREYLNNPSLNRLAGNKITSWNGQWLSYSFSKNRRPDFDYATFDQLGFFKSSNDETVIETIKWSKLFFNLSNQFPQNTFIGYVFSLGEKNKTLGFYPFKFQQAQSLIRFYRKLFGENEAMKDAGYYETMYGVHIKRACELGAIGIQALEPDGLRKYFDKDKMPNLNKSIVSRKNGQSDAEFETIVQDAEKKDYENKIIPFRIYKTWLLAMITKNKEEMSDYTQEIAKAIYEYRAADKKGSKKRANIVKNQLFASKTKKGFLEALTEIISEVEVQRLSDFKELRDRIHLMNNEDFGYFVVLLKFDYAYQARIL